MKVSDGSVRAEARHDSFNTTTAEGSERGDSGKARPPAQGLVMGSLTEGGAQVSVPLGFGQQHPTIWECPLDAAGCELSSESACLCVLLPTPQAESPVGSTRACGLENKVSPLFPQSCALGNTSLHTWSYFHDTQEARGCPLFTWYKTRCSCSKFLPLS